MKKQSSLQKWWKRNTATIRTFALPLKIFWGLFVAGVLAVTGLFATAALGGFGPMPELEQLENPNTNLATQIISADGVELGKYYLRDNRTPITYQELPTNLVKALIATEDERFYSHSGIDWRGTLRALFYLGKKGGASTITQQLARQLFVGVRSRNKKEAIFQKVKEWVLSVQLERRYTKNELIAMYLNIYDFGYNADGVQSAARIYFDKTPQELSIQDCAVLVGMLKNSSLFNPIRRPKRVLSRRNVVFNQMLRNEYIKESESDSLKQLPLDIKFTPQSHREGLATYFRAYLKEFMDDWIANNRKPNGEKYNLYGAVSYTHLTLPTKA